MKTASWVTMLKVVALGSVILGLPTNAAAVLIGGVEFPNGAVSFADSVVLYEPLFGPGPAPSAANSEPSNALGVPEVPGSTAIGACSGAPLDCPFVSLGRGGRLTLQFTDNLLTGSDDASLDLWIFEVGPDIEDTFVEISSDGVVWFAVGGLLGNTGGIDIDAFGFDSTDTFGFVRLRDDPNEGGSSGASVGADIDAVGAISTIRTAPEPGALALLAFGLAAIGYRRKRT
jgi:hypothetical protein